MRTPVLALMIGVGLLAGVIILHWQPHRPSSDARRPIDTRVYQPRISFDTSGFNLVYSEVPAWSGSATLAEIAAAWRGVGQSMLSSLPEESDNPSQRLNRRIQEALLLNFEGRPHDALHRLDAARSIASQDDRLASEFLYTVIYFQGVTAMRCGENDNCIACRGETSCILPIHSSAVHSNQRGSRLAVVCFTEYLERFPDDIGVRWLLNLAHMTLGQYPDGVDSRFRIRLGRDEPEGGHVPTFRNIGARVGIDRLNEAGGGILDDFDRDGLLDFVTSSTDPAQAMAFFRNHGAATFEERATPAGLSSQLGGLYCIQTDFNDDGLLDVYVPRGAWMHSPIRPSLLQNNGDGTFSDVTLEAGLMDPVNSISACWADFDNDGDVDLYVCCERQSNRLFQNQGDGRFIDVAGQAGAQGDGTPDCKGATWFDFDNDADVDLLVTYLSGTAHLLRNNGDATFTDVTESMGIDGPERGFACWSWDYDNDGWIDLFATCYDLDLNSVVKGIIGLPHDKRFSRLYRNLGGRFQDVTRAAGLDMVFGTMGCNFGDVDNDGFLDFYLGTGDPRLETLIPNRMFRNIDGRSFAEVTTSSRTGHLQKGHSVGFGDWDRDGDNDLFVEMGGAVPGDAAHNVLFENPGNQNRSLTLRLIGTVSPRTAVASRVELVMAGTEQRRIHRVITTGGSFGANPFEQAVGLGAADRIASLTIRWPGRATPQTLHDIPAGQSIVVLESGVALALKSR